MTSTANMKQHLIFISRQITKFEKILSDSPPGTLYIRTNRTGRIICTKYLKESDGSSHEIYLGIQNSEITPLANKRYAQIALRDLYKEKKLLERNLTYHSEKRQLEQFLRRHPAILTMISPGLRPMDQLAREWAEQPYPRSTKYPDALKYPTVIPKLLVRSKAEADLAGRFQHFGVPFHYEELLSANGEELAMDFVLLNARTGRKYYWDHRGMSDDPAYLQKVHYCEKRYLEMGIIPWVNLIVTTETRNDPLDIPWVDELIQHFLL